MIGYLPVQLGSNGFVKIRDIEESAAYASIGGCVKSVEFIRAIDDKLVFVEAKTTFPNPDNPSAGNDERFQAEINYVCDKFIHSLNLYSSIRVGVNEETLADVNRLSSFCIF